MDLSSSITLVYVHLCIYVIIYTYLCSDAICSSISVTDVHSKIDDGGPQSNFPRFHADLEEIWLNERLPSPPQLWGWHPQDSPLNLKSWIPVPVIINVSMAMVLLIITVHLPFFFVSFI